MQNGWFMIIKMVDLRFSKWLIYDYQNGGFKIFKIVDLRFSKWWIYDYQNGGFKIFKMVDLRFSKWWFRNRQIRTCDKGHHLLLPIHRNYWQDHQTNPILFYLNFVIFILFLFSIKNQNYYNYETKDGR